MASDEYIDVKRDLDRMKKLFTRLGLKKEQELVLVRMGKRLPASEIREMREIEEMIVNMIDRKTVITSLQQRSIFETFKHQFHSSMRAWKNRMAFSEHHRERKRKSTIPSES
jgi:hypothetical protein